MLSVAQPTPALPSPPEISTSSTRDRPGILKRDISEGSNDSVAPMLMPDLRRAVSWDNVVSSFGQALRSEGRGVDGGAMSPQKAFGAFIEDRLTGQKTQLEKRITHGRGLYAVGVLRPRDIHRLHSAIDNQSRGNMRSSHIQTTGRSISDLIDPVHVTRYLGDWKGTASLEEMMRAKALLRSHRRGTEPTLTLMQTRQRQQQQQQQQEPPPQKVTVGELMERCKGNVSSEDALDQKPPAKEYLAKEEDEVELVSCFICMDDYKPASIFTISQCGHKFCNNCMSTYVVSKINSNMVGPRDMVCPDPYCKEGERSLTEDDVRSILSTQSWRFRNYLKLRNRQMIDSNPNMKWCIECSDGVVALQPKTWKWSVPCSTENCSAKCCPRCALPSHPFTTCSRAMQRHTGMYLTSNDCKRCPSCNSMIDKDGGCNHMTCSMCRHQFCWLCRGNWNGGCKNKLCRPNDWLNRKLGCAAPVLKPVVVVVGAPVGVGLGAVAVGVGIGCAAIAGSLAVPYFLLIKFPFEWHRKRRKRREIAEVTDRYNRSQTAQNGIGLTFVGASQEFKDWVALELPGRYVERPEMREGDDVVPEEDGIADTFVAWRDFAINICFRDATTTAPRVADFATDVTPRADVDRRGEHKPHFVYMMHNVFSSAQDAQGSGLAVQLGTWRGARTNRGVVPRSLAVMDYRTEIHLLNARGAGLAGGAMPSGDILGAGGLTHAQIFELAEVHIMEQLGYIGREESLTMAAQCVENGSREERIVAGAGNALM
ncbi:hypothetical protein TrLO_g806 [Triparma laevis f. longispina]|uniref:RBR-type E3 ubiquitin transferase n=1 Tax=Triparma laevis f. longispina TaxID=1714387 RepID=A0A9W7E1S9_9STRA|nr:hypothetical protein TrLO_g806 [Triparma laevis f. longispina]